MRALVLETTRNIAVRDIELSQELGPRDVRIRPLRVGICGSDIHYYLHGRIGDFVVKEPMVLGHEASGVVLEIGSEVTSLNPGDRVCMEPGIPNVNSREYLTGMYNLDPDVQFWATPPVHGCLCESVVHPEQFTFRLPDHVSLEEGALVEPLAIGVHSAKKARIVPGDTALVLGAGTIGIVIALAAVASGCSTVYISDVKQDKLEFLQQHYPNLISINSKKHDLSAYIQERTVNGVDVVFEASGSAQAIASMTQYVRPGGRIVLVGMPNDPVAVDIVSLEAKEIDISSVFRYAHVFDRAVNYIGSGQIQVKPLHTHTFSFGEAEKAVEFAASMPPDAIKIIINME